MDYEKNNVYDVSILSDAELLHKIGGKLKELRLEQNVKQKELAEKSGLSMFSISQMETGHNTSVQSIVQVLRALGRLDMIDAFVKSGNASENPLADRQRVSRNVPFPNKAKVTTYSLPEDSEFGMAAENAPWES